MVVHKQTSWFDCGGTLGHALWDHVRHRQKLKCRNWVNTLRHREGKSSSGKKEIKFHLVEGGANPLVYVRRAWRWWMKNAMRREILEKQGQWMECSGSARSKGSPGWQWKQKKRGLWRGLHLVAWVINSNCLRRPVDFRLFTWNVRETTNGRIFRMWNYEEFL